MPQKSPSVRKKHVNSGNDFKSVAKRLGCDEDKAAFEKKLGKIAKAHPSAAKKQTQYPPYPR
jgi:hypothetical protein